MGAWIFQGNEKHFDIKRYVQSCDTIWWSIRKSYYVERVQVGDDVFLWNSDNGVKGSGGIIAHGVIISAPELKSDSENKEFWHNEEWSDVGYRVQIRLMRYDFENMAVRRIALLSHPILKNLQIIKLANGTNYPLTDEQFTLLNTLWNRKHEELMNFPIEKDSWTIHSNTVFVKRMDKSSFIHKGTGIPKELLMYWDAQDMKLGEKRKIKGTFNNVSYNFELSCEKNELHRVRLFWKKEFSGIIKQRFPNIYESVSEGGEESYYPIMRFEKIDSFEYRVTLIDERLIVTDLNSDADGEDEIFEKELMEEGRQVTYFGKRYERDPKCRKLAIEYHGTNCAICNFNFEETYGAHGEGFIEVHHTKPLYQHGKEVLISPYEDLVPVCSNCHRIIHRKRENVLSIDMMKAVLAKARIGK